MRLSRGMGAVKVHLKKEVDKLTRILCVLLGYFFGCFMTAELVTRKVVGKRAGEIGSGNPGTANIGASLGVKWAAVVLAGDILKTAIPCLLCRFVLFNELGVLAILYTGFGAAIGHNFPFWNRFKGGMGVAVTCTYVVISIPVWGLLANIAGLTAVMATGYLAVGAVLIPVIHTAAVFLICGAEAGAVAIAGMALLISRHMGSFRRIRNKKEKKTDILKALRRRR